MHWNRDNLSSLIVFLELDANQFVAFLETLIFLEPEQPLWVWADAMAFEKYYGETARTLKTTVSSDSMGISSPSSLNTAK